MGQQCFLASPDVSRASADRQLELAGKIRAVLREKRPEMNGLKARGNLLKGFEIESGGNCVQWGSAQRETLCHDLCLLDCLIMGNHVHCAIANESYD